jgi:hypothetical protein
MITVRCKADRKVKGKAKRKVKALKERWKAGWKSKR